MIFNAVTQEQLADLGPAAGHELMKRMKRDVEEQTGTPHSWRHNPVAHVMWLEPVQERQAA